MGVTIQDKNASHSKFQYGRHFSKMAAMEYPELGFLS